MMEKNEKVAFVVVQNWRCLDWPQVGKLVSESRYVWLLGGGDDGEMGEGYHTRSYDALLSTQWWVLTIVIVQNNVVLNCDKGLGYCGRWRWAWGDSGMMAMTMILTTPHQILQHISFIGSLHLDTMV